MLVYLMHLCLKIDPIFFLFLLIDFHSLQEVAQLVRRHFGLKEPLVNFNFGVEVTEPVVEVRVLRLDLPVLNSSSDLDGQL